MDVVERFVDDVVESIQLDHYGFLIEATRNAFTAALFAISEAGATRDADGVSIFEEYSERIQRDLSGIGILLIHKAPGEVRSYKIFPYYNPELYVTDQFELILYQELGVEPKEEERRAVLKKSLKAEKIKQSLVYSCYEDNRAEIVARVKQASKAQLDKRLQYTGTPLGFCARHDNLEGFKAVASAGANVGKVSLSRTPLAIAFEYSPDIVRYIYSNYREIFDKEVNKKGFLLASRTRDLSLFQLLLEAGCDWQCEGQNFPPLHNFADYNNLAGIQFLIDKGIDLGLKNKRKQTALDRAMMQNNVEAIDLLKACDSG